MFFQKQVDLADFLWLIEAMISRLRWQNLTFRIQTWLIIAGTLSSVILGLGWFSYQRQYKAILQESHRRLDHLSLVSGSTLDTTYLEFLIPQEENTASRYYRRHFEQQERLLGFDAFFLFDDQARLYCPTDSTVTPALLRLNFREVTRLKPGQAFLSQPFRSANGNWYLWGFYRLNKMYWLGLQENVRQLARLDQLPFIFGGAALLGIVLAMLLGWFIAGQVSRPLKKMLALLDSGGKAWPPGTWSAPEWQKLSRAIGEYSAAIARQKQEREELLAQIAHEIRNPLGGIELLAGLIAEQQPVESKSHHFAQTIAADVRRLKTQLSQFLEYSQPLQIESEECNLPELFSGLQPFLSPALQGRQIGFQTAFQVKHIRFTRDHLQQIVLNLLLNSIQALDSAGEIRISSAEQDGLIKLVVEDNGPGIPEALAGNLFEPFISGRRGGTGLGLAVCRRLAEGNRAKLELTSVKPALFTLTIDRNHE